LGSERSSQIQGEFRTDVAYPGTNVAVPWAPGSVARTSVGTVATVDRSNVYLYAKNIAFQVLSKAIASGTHFGIVNNLTRNLIPGTNLASTIANAAASATATAVMHFIMEEIVKELISGYSNTTLVPTRFDADELGRYGQPAAVLNRRADDARKMGTVNSFIGAGAGMLSFGAMQGVRQAQDWDVSLGSPVLAGGAASAFGGALMQFSHLAIMLSARIDDRALASVQKTLPRNTRTRLPDALNVLRARKIFTANPQGQLVESRETGDQVARRIAHDIFVGRAVPLFQGILARHLANLVVPSGYGAGMAGSLSLLGAGVFTTMADMKARESLPNTPFAGIARSWASLNEPSGQMASLIDSADTRQGFRAVRGLLAALDQINSLAHVLFSTPGHLALDSVHLVASQAQQVAASLRGTQPVDLERTVARVRALTADLLLDSVAEASRNLQDMENPPYAQAQIQQAGSSRR
jgi:hypothetical protein